MDVQEEFLGKIMFEWSFERQKSKLNKRKCEKKEIITTYFSGLKFFSEHGIHEAGNHFKKIFLTSTPDFHLSPSFDGWKTTPEDKSLETHTARKRQSWNSKPYY